MTEAKEVMIQPVGNHGTDPFVQQDTSPASIICPLCEAAPVISAEDAKELVQLRALDSVISFQKVFSDVSGILLYFEGITEHMTVGELLAWIKDELEKLEYVETEHSL